MESRDPLRTELTKSTLGAINAYCRVLELQVKVVEQTGVVTQKTLMSEMASEAMKGLKRELEFLDFLRNDVTGVVEQTDSPDEL